MSNNLISVEHLELSGKIIDVIPTNKSQREIWMSIDLDENASLAYNEMIKLELKSEIDIDGLKKLLFQLILKFPELLTTFSTNGEFQFFHEPQNKFLLKLIKTHNFINYYELKDYEKREINTFFDLKNGPLLNFHLIKVNQIQYLYLKIHHIICDGVSLNLLINEIKFQLTHVNDSNISIDNLKKLSFSHFQNKKSIIKNYLKNEISEQALKFWKNKYKSIPAHSHRFYQNHFQDRTFQSARLDLDFSYKTQLIENLAKKSKLSFYTYLVKCFTETLNDYEGLRQNLISTNKTLTNFKTPTKLRFNTTYASQYDFQELQQTIGHSVKILPLEFEQIPIGESWPSHTFSQILNEQLSHSQMTLGELVTQIPREDSTFVDYPFSPLTLNIDAQETVNSTFSSVYTVPRDYDNFEFFCNICYIKGQKLSFEVQYQTQVLNDATVSLFINLFIKKCEEVRWTDSDRKEIAELSFKSVNELKVPSFKNQNQDLSSPSADVIKVKAPNSIINSSDIHNLEILKELWIKNLASVELQKSINVDQSFFSLGGHSLKAVSLAKDISETFNINFKIKDVFKNSTLSSQIRFINDLLNRQSETDELLLPTDQSTSQSTVSNIHVSPSEEFDLREQQNQIIFLEKLDPENALFNLPAAFKFYHYVSFDILKNAFYYLIQKHPLLNAQIIETLDGYKIKLKNMTSVNEVNLLHLKMSESDAMDHMEKLSTTPLSALGEQLYQSYLYSITDDDSYYFFFNVHHIIWDGWSFDVFFKDLNEFIKLAQNKNANEVINAQKDKSYFSFQQPTSFNQSQHLTRIKPNLAYLTLEKKFKFHDLQIQHWIETNSIQIEPINFNYKFKNKPLHYSSKAENIDFEFNQYEVEKINKFVNYNNLTAHQFLLAVYIISLSQITQSEVISVGIPFRNRQSDIELDSVGYYVNIVPLVFKINLDDSIFNIILSIKDHFIKNLDFESLSYASLKNSLASQNSSFIRSELFQVFYSFQDVENRKGQFNDQDYTQINLSHKASHAELDVWFKYKSSKIEGAFHYKVDLFDKEYIEQFSEIFFQNINSALTESDKRISKLQLQISKPDSILSKLSQFGIGKSLELQGHDYFNQTLIKQCLKQNSKIAVRDQNHSMSYGELLKITSFYKNYFSKILNSSQPRVVILLNRDVQVIPVLFALITAKISFIPVDASLPQERIKFIVDHSEAELILADTSTHDLLPQSYQDKLLIINDILRLNHIENLKSQTSKFQLNSTAYIIYTSGTTGQPKGVSITYNALENFLKSMILSSFATEQTKWLALTTLSFDISLLEVLAPILAGGEIYLAQKFEILDTEHVQNLIDQFSINTVQATPSTWKHLFQSNINICSSIFKALCGGEKLSLDLLQLFNKNKIEVYNMYGPTETTIWSTFSKLNTQSEIIHVGQPIHNTYTLVLNDSRMQIPIGSIGELYIGGICVSEGYYKNESLTQTKFCDFMINNKLTRFFATGDLATFNFNGDLIIYGRKDSQVKVRGYRVELLEIQNKITQLLNIYNLHVFTSEIKGENEILLAVKNFHSMTQNDLNLEAHTNRQVSQTNNINTLINLNELNQKLAQYLPHYMLVYDLFYVDEIPKNHNQKIDEKKLVEIYRDFVNKTAALPQAENLKLTRSETMTAVEIQARTKIKNHNVSIEQLQTRESASRLQQNESVLHSKQSEISFDHIAQVILQILEEALRRPVKLNDNFFSLGGHSLQALQISLKIEKTLLVKLPLAEFINAQQLKDLVAYVHKIKQKQLSPDLSTTGSNPQIASIVQNYNNLVFIKPQGHLNPLYCFHAVGGNVLNYVQLKSFVPLNKPLIGVQSSAFSNQNEIYKSIEEMASAYIQEILTYQPSGPYTLAGGSMGGMLAFEVAAQLQKRGYKIDKLILFDTFGPNANLKSYVNTHKRGFTLSDLKQKIELKFAHLKHKFLLGIHKFIQIQLPTETLIYGVQLNNYKALLNYQAPLYHGDLHLIRVLKQATGLYSDPFMGWRNSVTGSILTHEIDSSHEAFIESEEFKKTLQKILES